MPRPGSGTIDLRYFWRHTVTVERYFQDSAYGAVYDAEVQLTGLVDDSQRLVAAPNGVQVTSTATVLLPVDTATIPLQSRVTLPAAFGGRVTHVIAAALRDSGGLPLPDHLELNLQ